MNVAHRQVEIAEGKVQGLVLKLRHDREWQALQDGMLTRVKPGSEPNWSNPAVYSFDATMTWDWVIPVGQWVSGSSFGNPTSILATVTCITVFA